MYLQNEKKQMTIKEELVKKIKSGISFGTARAGFQWHKSLDRCTRVFPQAKCNVQVRGIINTQLSVAVSHILQGFNTRVNSIWTRIILKWGHHTCIRNSSWIRSSALKENPMEYIYTVQFRDYKQTIDVNGIGLFCMNVQIQFCSHAWINIEIVNNTICKL